MVTIGFSKPYIAKYSNVGTTVTYTDGMALGRGVDLNLSVDVSDDNHFYADNVLAETETSEFVSGTVALTIDGLKSAAAKMIYGLPDAVDLKVGETTIKMQGYGAAMTPPNIGFGCVRCTMDNGKKEYWPFILPKIKFAIHADEMKTKEETIEWQTQAMEATVQRDDTAEKNWKLISETGLSTEAEAEAAVIAYLGGGAA